MLTSPSSSLFPYTTLFRSVQLVCEGRAIPYCRVRIADDEDRELPEERIGHLHMTGDNVTRRWPMRSSGSSRSSRSEEHTSELQSRVDLVCRLLLEKKKTRQ